MKEKKVKIFPLKKVTLLMKRIKKRYKRNCCKNLHFADGTCHCTSWGDAFPFDKPGFRSVQCFDPRNIPEPKKGSGFFPAYSRKCSHGHVPFDNPDSFTD